MDFRRNPRVFRAWRVERLKNPGPGKGKTNRQHPQRRQGYIQKGR